jgi:hypothetical protein
LMRGKFHRGVVQQIANGRFLDVLFQASATTGKRIPLYLRVHEARTPMFLMRHGCRLTHFLISYISIVVPTTALTSTPFHCKCMHTRVRHGPRTGVCQDLIYLAMLVAWRADSAPHRSDWIVGYCQVGSVSQSARTASLSSAFSSSQPAAHCPSLLSTPAHGVTAKAQPYPEPVLPQQCLPRNPMQS